MEWNEFCGNLKDILEFERYRNNKYIDLNFNTEKIQIKYKFRDDKSVRFTYTKQQFLNDYKNTQDENELCVFDEKFYESPISIKGEFSPIILKHDKIIEHEYNDEEKWLDLYNFKAIKTIFV